MATFARTTSFDPEFFFPADPVNAAAKTDSQLLQAARVTAHWRARDMRVMPDLSAGPLFGGDKQSSLFDEPMPDDYEARYPEDK